MSGCSKSTFRVASAACLFAAVLLTRATGALAGSSPTNSPWNPSEPLTLEQATQRALACDPRIATLKGAVEVARQQRLAATDIKDPVLQAESRSMGRTGGGNNDDLDDSRVSLGVYVPNLWLMVPRASARTADYRAAQADLNAALWLVQCDVRQLFAQMCYLTNELVFSADRVRLSGEVLKATQARVEQGAAAATDLMTASRQYLQFQNDFDQASHNYQLVRQQLASLLDIAPGSFELATNEVPLPSLPQTDPTFQQAEAMASASRWDLAALRWRTQAAESSYHEVRNERLPWVKEVKAGYMDNSSRNSDRYWIGIAADIPIFSLTKNHAAGAALAKSTLARISETNGLKLVRQDLHDALDELDRARRQAGRNDSTMKPLITTMRQTLATLKSAPNIMPEQLAAAEMELAETLRFDLATRWQYELALLNLERALGAPLRPENAATQAR